MCLKWLLVSMGLWGSNEEVVNSPSERVAMTGEPSPARGRFKIIGHLVLAVKRFQAALNPTVSFGRRDYEPLPYRAPSLQQAGRSLSEPPVVTRRTVTGAGARTMTTVPGSQRSGTYRRLPTNRGHMTSYIFRPLGSIKGEA